MFGLMNITGYPDEAPAKPGVALTGDKWSRNTKRIRFKIFLHCLDISTGLYCHGAIMAALIQRMKTGLGQKIDASLLNTQVIFLFFQKAIDLFISIKDCCSFAHISQLFVCRCYIPTARDGSRFYCSLSSNNSKLF